MSAQVALAVAFGLLAVATWLLAELYRENARLRRARSRSARIMRRCRRERDFARADFASAIETSVELQREIDEWESGKRRAGVVRFNARLN